MDFRSRTVKELPDVVDGVGNDPAAGMPGRVAKLRADLVNPAVMSIQGGAGKGRAAHADEDLVRTIVDEAVAVRTPVLERLGRLYPNVRLKMISDTFFDLGTMDVMKVEWSEESEAAELAQVDIGLAPAADDPWCRGKCGLKIVQYLASGKPVVCTPVGANAEIVADGVHGLWARTREEWFGKLKQIIEDAPMRKRMGEAGRELVGEHYSLCVNAPRMAKALREVVQGDA